MNFNVALRGVEVGQRIGSIENSGRIYPCFVCGTRTKWHSVGEPDNPGVPICSDECLDQYDGEQGSTSAPDLASSTFAQEKEMLVVEVVNLPGPPPPGSQSDPEPSVVLEAHP